MPVATNATTFPTVTIQINDVSPVPLRFLVLSLNTAPFQTKPFWAYCRQSTPVSHCESGMVFSVNAVENSDSSFEAFQAKALALNTTASASGSASLSSPSATSTSNSALSIHGIYGAGTVIAIVGAAVGVLL